MKFSRMFSISSCSARYLTAGLLIPAFLCLSIHAEEPRFRTGLLGGVRDVSVDDLQAMQKGNFVLHARDGVLTKVPVEKSRLPHDPQGHVQAISAFLAADGAVYVKQQTILCKSSDGGRTWASWKFAESEKNALWQVRPDGNWISVGANLWGKTNAALPVKLSRDEGRAWNEIAQIRLPERYDERHGFNLFRSAKGVLMCGISCRDHVRKEGQKHVSGIVTLNLYRSRDGGVTWDGPHKVADWCHEGGLVETASGKLVAVLRYQRAILASDPPDILKRWDLQRYDGSELPFPYKHVFLANSTDGGKTWTKLRQLTTVHGQCYGYPAALRDGTVVIVHDTRYGPGEQSGRALISRDEGERWEDESYYLYHGLGVTGYSQSVVLPDEVILTVAGTSDELEARGSWNAATGKSVLTAIRWKPVPSAKPEPVDSSGRKEGK